LRTFAITASSAIPCSRDSCLLAAGGGSSVAFAVNEECRRPFPRPQTHACDGGVFSGDSRPLQHVEAGVEGVWSPWETHRRRRLAGGRPQLTAGIRAGSYAHQCSNRGFPPSMQPIGRRMLQAALQSNLHTRRATQKATSLRAEYSLGAPPSRRLCSCR